MSNDRQERVRRFSDLLVCLTNSPLYKQKLAEYNTMNVGLDRVSTLPITVKAELQKAVAFGHLAVDRKEATQYHESSGTTDNAEKPLAFNRLRAFLRRTPD